MKNLTKAEEEIMQIIWKIEPCTVGQIRDFMEQKLKIEKPAHSTVSTFLRLLVEKSFLHYKEYGKTFLYSSCVSKQQYSYKSIKKIIGDYFKGSPKELMSFLIDNNDISLKEIQEIVNNSKKEKK